MAVLTIAAEQRTLIKPDDIRPYLSEIGIEYDHWSLDPGIDKDSHMEEILQAYRGQIGRVMEQGGYRKVDVVDVSSATPGLDAMLAKFSREHWHDEEEVRFVVHGRGVYHVHPSGRPVCKLEVEAGDMIRVPRGTLHWFDLCSDREIKAIRFFQDPAGWAPFYTESELEREYKPVCFGPTYIVGELSADTAWLGPK